MVKKRWMKHTDYMISTFNMPKKVKKQVRKEMASVPSNVIKRGEKESSLEDFGRIVFKEVREQKGLLKYKRR